MGIAVMWLFGSGYDVCCLLHTHLVALSILVFWSVPYKCCMHPWSPHLHIVLIQLILYVRERWNFMWVSVSLFDWGCLFCNAAWLLSSLSHMMGHLLNLSSRPLVSLLNRSVTGLGSLGLTAVDRLWWLPITMYCSNRQSPQPIPPMGHLQGQSEHALNSEHAPRGS